MNTPADPRSHARSRAMLLLIVAMFMAPLVLALVLHYSGWQPARTKNVGELVKPPVDLRDLDLRHADGSAFTWHHQDHTWRVLVVAPEQCGDPCARLADALRRDWVGLGKDADRVQVLWVGDVPATMDFAALVRLRPSPGLQARLPDRSAIPAIPAYVVDPSGYLILRYAPGFNPIGLRKDLAQLLK